MRQEAESLFQKGLKLLRCCSSISLSLSLGEIIHTSFSPAAHSHSCAGGPSAVPKPLDTPPVKSQRDRKTWWFNSPELPANISLRHISPLCKSINKFFERNIRIVNIRKPWITGLNLQIRNQVPVCNLHNSAEE